MTGSFVCVHFYLLRLFYFCLLNLFIYFVLGYHIRWWNTVVYIFTSRRQGRNSYRVCMSVYLRTPETMSLLREFFKYMFLWPYWLDVPDRVLFKLDSNSSPVSERPRTTVSVGALHPGLQCWHAAASAFRQPSPTCRTTFPAQHLRPSGVLSCRPDGLELNPGFYPGSNEQHRLF